QVVFTGYITEKEVSSYLLTGDLFIFPTTHAEGFPNILFRAVSLGLPVVTTKIRAAAEYLREPENCLFSTDDPANIADKISEHIEDGSLRARMSASNVEFGRQLTPDVVAAEYLKIYDQLCRSPEQGEDEVNTSAPSDRLHSTTQ